MNDLRCDSRVVFDAHNGPIVCISFQGTYPPGSEGNPLANTMMQRVAETVEQLQPAAVIFDLTGLDYVWGDAIGTIVLPLVRAKMGCPTCVVAVGRTARALEPLFARTSLFGVVGTKLMVRVNDALSYLKEQLNRPPA